MNKPLRNAKHEKFVRAVFFEGVDPADAYVAAGYKRDRANHHKLMRNPHVKQRIAELTEERELAARAARAPIADVVIELERHGIERVADFYENGPTGGGLVVRDLSAVKVEIARSLLNSLHDGFGISWDHPTQ